MAEPAALPTLTTPRLVLRAPRHDDAVAIADLANDLGVARMVTSMPHPFPVGGAESFVKKQLGSFNARHALFALATPKDTFMGVLGFDPPRPDAACQHGVEIGYWLGRPFWGQGLMTEAVRAALAWAAGDWGRRVVVGGHFADNPGSGAVLIKAGFLYTGDVLTVASKARDEPAAMRRMVWLA